MSRIVIFHEKASTHEEEYLARLAPDEFTSVSNPRLSNLDFDTVAEAYEFAAEFPGLQHWRVGVR